MKNFKKSPKFGIARFLVVALVLGGGLIYGVGMVQKNQENRSKAASIISNKGYGASCRSNGECKSRWCANTYNVCAKKNSDDACIELGGTCNARNTAANGTACNTNGKNGKVKVGLCYATKNKRCCIPNNVVTPTPAPIVPTITPIPTMVATDSACTSKGGTCIQFDKVLPAGSACTVNGKSGTVKTGLCGGDLKRKCCIPNN